MEQSWALIAGILGGVVLITNAATAISKWVMPVIKNRKQAEENSAKIAQLEEAQNYNLEMLQNQAVINKMLVKSMLTLINHMIDGNHREQMQETRDELQDLLVKL